MTASSERTARLGLGTAQFGLDYGATNTKGRVPLDEVATILCSASCGGITTVDTARSYGASEAVIGQSLSTDHSFRIVTKTAKIAGLSPEEATRTLRVGFQQSLRDLRQPSVEALLVHSVDDLLGSAGPAIWKAMCALRDLGLVSKLGVSVYSGSEIDAVLDRFPIEIIQVPFNAFDQRLTRSGHFQKLADQEVEIHVRSIFLQGLLVYSGPLLGNFPREIQEYLCRLHQVWAEAGLSPLAGALSVAVQTPEISTILVGVANNNEMIEVFDAFKHACSVQGPMTGPDFDLADHWIIDPRRWPKRA